MHKLYFISDIRKSNSSCQFFNGKKKYIATADVQNSKIVNFELVDFNNKPSRANLISEKGSVLFAKMQNTIKVLEINDDNCNNIYSTGFYSFKDERILPRYLRYFFESKLFNSIKDKNCQGATMKAINDDAMEKISINVPSINCQQIIIDKLFHINDLIKKNNFILERLDNIVKSQFIEMFGNPIDNNKMWPSDKAVNLCQIVTDGSHFSPVADENGNIPMLSVKDMRINTFCYDNCKMIGEDIYQIMLGQGCVPQIGDVLVAKDGSYFTRAFAIKEFRKQAILSSIGMYRPNQVKILPRFLADYLMSDKVIDFVNNGYVTGSALKRVIIKGLKEIPIYIPPVNLQSKYILFVEQIDKSKYFGGVCYGL